MISRSRSVFVTVNTLINVTRLYMQWFAPRATPSRSSSAQLILPYTSPCLTLSISSSHVLINARGEIASYFASVLIMRSGDRVQVNDRDRVRVHDRRPSDRDYRCIRAFTNRGRHVFLVNRLGTIAGNKGWKIVISQTQPGTEKDFARTSNGRTGNLNKRNSLARNAICNNALS